MAYRFVEPRTRVGDGIVGFGGAQLFFFDFGTTNPKPTFKDFALTVPNTDPVVADANGLFGDIFLDIQADVTLESSTDIVIYGPESIFAPEDGITTLAASLVAVADSAGNFTAINVETVLAEISDDWARLARINTFSEIQTFTAALQISDQELRRALILDYAIKHNSISSVSGVLTIDMSTGNSFSTLLTENITSIVITNPPATGIYGEFVLRITQDDTSSFTVVLPTSVDIPSGATYTMTASSSARDKLTFSTIDAGTIFDVDFSQAYS